MPRCTIAGESACASRIGARRLTVSARSISSTENESQPAAARQPGVRHQHVDAPGLLSSASTASGSARSDLDRPPADLLRERLSTSTAGRSAATRHRARAAPARWPGPRPPVAPVNNTRAPSSSCEHRHRGRKGMQEVATADRADLARGEEARGGDAAQPALDRLDVVVPRGRTSHARGRCRRTAAHPPAAGRPARSCRARASRADRRPRCRRRGRASGRPGRGARRRRSRSDPCPGRRPRVHARENRPAGTRACWNPRRSRRAARPARAGAPPAGAPRSCRAASPAPACPPAR